MKLFQNLSTDLAEVILVEGWPRNISVKLFQNLFIVLAEEVV